MINVKELPKEPSAAVEHIISSIIALGDSKAKISDLRKSVPDFYRNLLVCSIAGKKAAAKLNDPVIGDELKIALELTGSKTFDTFKEGLHGCLELLYASKFDDHFIDQQESEAFDEAILDSSEKAEIRNLMTEARRLTERLDSLGQNRRRNILFWISKVEDELLRDVSRFQSFIAAAAEVGSLVRQLGEDAKPISEAVSEARTITQRKVEGYRQIEAEEKPKQIEDKSDD